MSEPLLKAFIEQQEGLETLNIEQYDAPGVPTLTNQYLELAPALLAQNRHLLAASRSIEAANQPFRGNITLGK